MNYFEESTTVNYEVGLRKHTLAVYNYMFTGLSITALVSWLCMNTSLGSFFYEQTLEGMSLTILGWVALLAPFAIIFLFGKALNEGRSDSAKNLFWLMAALYGISLTPIFLVYTGASITKAFVVSAVTFGGMSLYGYTTKKDLTNWGSLLFVALIAIIVASIFNMFMGSPLMDYIITIGGIVVFMGLIAYDTQKMKDEYSQGVSPLSSALSLYLDFINLFLFILKLVGSRD